MALREGGEQVELTDREAEGIAAREGEVFAGLAATAANTVISALPPCEKPVNAGSLRWAPP